MTIHERFGRLQEKFEAEYEAHLATLELLCKLKAGEILLADIEVTATSWLIVAKINEATEKSAA